MQEQMTAEQLRKAKRPKARARKRPEPGTMNKLEKRRAHELDLQQKSGYIQSWAFEPVKFRLAKSTFYTPDFMVVHNDGLIEFQETKGFWEDDARVKIKVAAEMFPMFQFLAMTPDKNGVGGWKREEF